MRGPGRPATPRGRSVRVAPAACARPLLPGFPQSHVKEPLDRDAPPKREHEHHALHEGYESQHQHRDEADQVPHEDRAAFTRGELPPEEAADVAADLRIPLEFCAKLLLNL